MNTRCKQCLWTVALFLLMIAIRMFVAYAVALMLRGAS